MDCEKKWAKASYIGEPKDNTVLYIVKKLEGRVSELDGISGCLLFAETGMSIPKKLIDENTVEFVDNPVLSFTNYVDVIACEREREYLSREYTLTSGGYWLGENVSLGKDVHVEPGVVIGHDVTIGDGTLILSQATIKHATIGKNCLIKSQAVIGGEGFTFATDENGNEVRMHAMGDIVIGDYVEIGSNATICRGSNSDTTILDYAKIDDHVHVGHDVRIGSNAVLTAGVVLGGYDRIGDHAYIGLNASLRQFVNVEDMAQISMGARVARDVSASNEMFGVPSRS